MVVSYEAQSPELAQKVVSRLVEAYLAEHGRLNRTSGAHDFFAQQTGAMKTRLTEAEERLREFKNRTGMVSPDAERQLLAARISRLEEELAQNGAAVAAAEAKIRRYREALDATPKTGVVSQTAGTTDHGTDLMREQFYALQLQDQAAAVKYTEAHPLRRQLHEQTVAAQEILSKEGRSTTQVTTAPTKTREQAELAVAADEPALAALRAEGASRRAEVAELRNRLKTFNEDELTVARLQREVDLCAANYRKYSESLEQARIDQSLESQRISNISLAQPASLEAQPVRPKAAMNLLLGLVAGLSGAVGVAYAADARRRRPKTREVVEETPKPVVERRLVSRPR